MRCSILLVSSIGLTSLLSRFSTCASSLCLISRLTVVWFRLSRRLGVLLARVRVLLLVLELELALAPFFPVACCSLLRARRALLCALRRSLLWRLSSKQAAFLQSPLVLSTLNLLSCSMTMSVLVSLTFVGGF